MNANELGEKAARLKWDDGLSWPKVYACFPDDTPSKVRGAARRWKKSNTESVESVSSGREMEEATFEKTGNNAIAQSTALQIATLDQLLEICKVDLTVWQVIDYSIKAYDGWRGDSVKNLTFEQGRITGTIKDSGIKTETLYSIKARLTRIVPLELTPTFKTIAPFSSYQAPQPKANGLTTSTLFFSDPHIGFDKDLKNSKLTPYHDRQMLSIVMQIAKDLQPDTIIVGGDLLDLAQWSRDFAKLPEFYWTTQPALMEAHWILAALRASCPETRIICLEGNHDERLPKYVKANVAEAYGLTAVDAVKPALSLPGLLALDLLGIDWVGGYGDGKATFSPRPWIKYLHGDIARVPGATAKAMTDKAISWRVFGHIHRCEMSSRSYEDAIPTTAVSFGCCCHTDGRVPGSKPSHQWQKRFGVISHGESADSVGIEVVTAERGVATWRGKVYQGEDYVEQLATAWPEWNWK